MLGIPDGGFRLFYSYPDKHIPNSHLDFSNLDEALNAAGRLYEYGYTLHQLLNWMGDKACPDDQITEVAKIRHWQQGEHRLAEHRRQTEEKMRTRSQEELETNPLYGMF